MDYAKTVLFSDLDGTLFDPRGEVSPENLAAIRRYMDLGGRFAISTGRQPDNAMWYLREVFTNAPSVVLNGSATYNFATGEYANCVYLDRTALWGYLRRMLSELPGMDIQMYCRAGIRYITPREQAQPQLLSLHNPCRFVTPEEMEGEEIFKCLLYAPPALEPGLLEILRPGDGRDFRIVPGTTDVGGVITYYELLPLGVSKSTAIDALRGDPSLAGRVFLAVGDYWNDYEMLRSADVAIAPANAPDGIKAVCRYVTVSNSEHCIAHIIDELIPAM